MGKPRQRAGVSIWRKRHLSKGLQEERVTQVRRAQRLRGARQRRLTD